MHPVFSQCRRVSCRRSNSRMMLYHSLFVGVAICTPPKRQYRLAFHPTCPILTSSFVSHEILVPLVLLLGPPYAFPAHILSTSPRSPLPLPRQMLRYDRRSGNLAVTDLGRVASHFYISNESVFRFNGAMMSTLSDSSALNTVCLASEFDQVKASIFALWCAIGAYRERCSSHLVDGGTGCRLFPANVCTSFQR